MGGGGRHGFRGERKRNPGRKGCRQGRYSNKESWRLHGTRLTTGSAATRPREREKERGRASSLSAAVAVAMAVPTHGNYFPASRRATRPIPVFARR